MKTVWKYEIDLDQLKQHEGDDAAEFICHMPTGSAPLHVDVQNGTPCLWALVDTERRLQQRTFLLVGTGHSINTDGRHVGSFQLARFVGHIFTL
jgi:hypothetical protein